MYTMVSPEKISFATKDEVLIGNRYGNGEPGVLFLHGAGASEKSRTEYLSQRLAHESIASFSFDFSGHGESSGTLRESSLQKRHEEVQAALKMFRGNPVKTIVGSSMGGYNTLKILEKYTPENIILFCPAMYDAKAFSLPFQEEFTKVIRKRKSWEQSDVLPLLSGYRGQLLVIIGEKDEIIPPKVIDLIENTSQNTRRKEVLRIPDAPHAIHSWLSAHPEERERVFRKIIECISNGT